MESFTYRIIIEPDKGGTFHGYVPALPGCHTWGDSVEDVRKKLKEAMNLYLADMVADGESIPQDKGFESLETVLLPDLAGGQYA